MKNWVLEGDFMKRFLVFLILILFSLNVFADNLNLQQIQKSCEPNSKVCHNDDSWVCNTEGNTITKVAECEFGCDEDAGGYGLSGQRARGYSQARQEIHRPNG